MGVSHHNIDDLNHSFALLLIQYVTSFKIIGAIWHGFAHLLSQFLGGHSARRTHRFTPDEKTGRPVPVGFTILKGKRKK